MQDQIIITTLLEDTVTVNDQTTAVLELSSVEDVVTVTEVAGDTITVQEVGTQGPKGDPGISTVVSVVAQENLVKYDVVTGDGKKADSGNLLHRNKLVGLATQNILSGFSGEVQCGGSLQNPAWTWTTGDRIYLNGTTLSTTAPDSGFLTQVGVAVGSDTINIEIQPSILL
jgi:hypothetical protein